MRIQDEYLASFHKVSFSGRQEVAQLVSWFRGSTGSCHVYLFMFTRCYLPGVSVQYIRLVVETLSLGD